MLPVPAAPAPIVQTVPVLPYDIEVFGHRERYVIRTAIGEPAVDLAVASDGLVGGSATSPDPQVSAAERAFSGLETLNKDAALPR